MTRRSIILVVYTAAMAAAIFAVSSMTDGGGEHSHSHAAAFSEPQGAAPQFTWGDIDCNGGTDSVDALKGLQFVAGLPFQQNAGCPAPEDEAIGLFWADWDCSGAVDSVDTLQLLRFLVGLAANQAEGCFDIGAAAEPALAFEVLATEPGWKDFGDAPDGTATGYSSGASTGSFPTMQGNAGPSHPFPFTVWLGEFATAEEAPVNGGDADDGVLAVDLAQCAESSALVTINPGGLTGGDLDGPFYVNVLADWNRDGDWSDNSGCVGEWAVQNEVIDLSGSNSEVVVMAVEFTGGHQVDEFWMRATVSREEYDPAAGGEFEGETEDYLVSNGGLAPAAAVPVIGGAATPQSGGGGGGAVPPIFSCAGGLVRHGSSTGSASMGLRLQQTQISHDRGHDPKSMTVKQGGSPLRKDGSVASEVNITNVLGGWLVNWGDSGLSELFMGAELTTPVDDIGLQGPFQLPILLEITTQFGTSKQVVTCGFYVDHSDGAESVGTLDGFRGGPGRAPDDPGKTRPEFIVVRHGTRLSLESDARGSKEDLEGSSYDPDSLTAFDADGKEVDPGSLGLRDIVIPAKGRGLFFDTAHDPRTPRDQLVVLRIKGKTAGGTDFVDYFRFIVVHDDDARLGPLIKKLLDEGLVQHFDEDEAFKVAYTADGMSIRSKIPPGAGLIWDEQTECVIGANSPASGVRDLMFGSLAYVIDYKDGGSDIFLRREADEIPQPSGEDDEDECMVTVSPPPFEPIQNLTNFGPGNPRFIERGNICVDRLTGAEFDLSQPGIPPFGIFGVGLEEIVLRAPSQPSGLPFPMPIPGGESHRYPNCFPMGDGKFGIVASTPGSGSDSVLAYVPLPCSGACTRGGANPSGESGFVLLEPAGPNDHFVRATVSPDGTKIAFQYDVRDAIGQLLNSQVYVGDFDPTIPAISNALPVTSEGFNGVPTWSGDSEQLAFVSNRDGNLEIYIMNADGSEQTNLTNTPDVNESSPSWQNP